MLFTRNKPEWLYRALPGVYLLAGLATLALSSEPIGKISAGLLMLAAVAIKSMRWQHQRRREHEALTAIVVPPAPPRRSALVQAEIAEALPPRVGHSEIDRQHRLLAIQAVRLRQAAQHRDAAPDLELELYELLDALAVHFRTENAELVRLGHPELAARAETNTEQLQQAEACLQRYRLGEKSLDTLIARVADQFVLPHLNEQHPVWQQTPAKPKDHRETVAVALE